MTVYLQDADLTLHHGDALETLRTLPAGSVNCCITSPPYLGLRDYGTGTWDGGNPDCDHTSPLGGGGSGPAGEGYTTPFRTGKQYTNQKKVIGNDCGQCGARRVDHQLGLEETPEQYVAALVAVLREVRRVLADDGTLWLNLGDSYASGAGEVGRNDNETLSAYVRSDTGKATGGRLVRGGGQDKTRSERRVKVSTGLKPKDLIGVPWRCAFALQADGWYLRSDIIWSKPNPMPESVTDRPTKAHEYVFLLSKSPRYWFDQEAVREPAEWSFWGKQTTRKVSADPNVKPPTYTPNGRDELRDAGAGRNIRSVWEIATQPYTEAHFATFPEELVRRCLLAGCPEWVCGVCGKPRERLTERVSTGKSYAVDKSAAKRSVGLRTAFSGYDDGSSAPAFQTVGWSDCGHGGNWRPGVVLDPFFGSGTTGLVARKHSRKTVGIELSSSYCGLAARRLQQLSLLAEGAA